MTLAPMGLLDLSLVTGLLTQTLSNYWDAAPLWATLSPGSNFTHTISGMTPDEARQTTAGGGCQVTVSLIHIEPSKFNRNFVAWSNPADPVGSNPPPPRAQLIPALPLALDLYYFVSAWSDATPPTSSIQEQQAISIVLNCFHQNPIVRTNVPFTSPPQSTPEEFTLTMEIESVDSISRFWQATTMPFRLSVMYRVAVVVLTPPAPPALAKQVSRFSLTVDPAPPASLAATGSLFGTSSTTTFIDPKSNPGSPQDLSVDYSPATVTPGQRFFLYGTNLNLGADYSGAPPNPGTSYRVYLTPSSYSSPGEVEITSWKVPDSGSPGAALQTVARLVLEVPTSEGSPLGAPPPGVYGIAVGSETNSDAINYRSNITPFSIAALVSAPGSPALPILTPVAGTYTVTGMGFIAGATQVMLETVPLDSTAGPPGPGQFTVVDTGTITFQAPTDLPSATLYGVRVRVNQVESPPAVWIQT